MKMKQNNLDQVTNDILTGAVKLPEKKRCECGGRLVNDFPTAYMCDTCKYYEIKGKVITRCDGTPTAEFVTCEYILYNGTPYKTVRRGANVGELVLLADETLAKRVHRITDYSGYHKRSILLENGEVVESHNYYHVLVPLCEVTK